MFTLFRQGDYYRYRAEFTSGATKKENAQSSLTAYNEAKSIAESSLKPTHPIRLG